MCNLYRKVLLGSIVLAMGGCATSSGVRELGRDTYTVEAYADVFRGRGAGARGIALGEATKFCESSGKKIVVLQSRSGFDRFSVDFQCLSSDDPAYK